jgi:hypothetical protein
VVSEESIINECPASQLCKSVVLIVKCNLRRSCFHALQNHRTEAFESCTFRIRISGSPFTSQYSYLHLPSTVENMTPLTRVSHQHTQKKFPSLRSLYCSTNFNLYETDISFLKKEVEVGHAYVENYSYLTSTDSSSFHIILTFSCPEVLHEFYHHENSSFCPHNVFVCFVSFHKKLNLIP